MKKLRKMLGFTAALVMVLAMGTVVYAATYSGSVSLKDLGANDILHSGAEVVEYGSYTGSDLDEGYRQNGKLVKVMCDGSQLSIGMVPIVYWSVHEDLRVVSVSTENTGSGYAAYTLYVSRDLTIPAEESSSVGDQQMSAAERWKNSPQNPDNYLPWFDHKDGTRERAKFPAHYNEGRDDCVYAVATTEEDFCRTLGIGSGNMVHMQSWHSLCGPLMQKLMEENAEALGSRLSAEVTLGEIFELETEIRDKDYKLLGLAEESETPVEIKIGIEGKLRELSDTMDFAVVMWKDGEVTILKDLDEEPWTITIETTRTSGVFGIVYAPAGSFAGLE